MAHGNKEFAGNSSIYHAVKGMLFIDNGLVFQIKNIFQNNEEEATKILNKERLRKIIYEKIKKYYNARIRNYELNYPQFGNSDIKNLVIKKYQFSKRNELGDEDLVASGGQFALYPRGFRCNVCGDYRIADKDNIQKFHDGKCLMGGCQGTYRQIALIKFCEKCGKLDEIYYETKDKSKKGSSTLKLTWQKQDEPITWRFVTSDKPKNPVDFLNIPCNHTNFGEKICNKPSSKYKPMSITSSGVIKPIVTTIIDIPDTLIKHPLLEQVTCAIVTGKLADLEDELQAKKENKSILEYIDSLYKSYKDDNTRSVLKNVFSELSEDEFEKELKKRFKIDLIDGAIHEISRVFEVGKIDFEEVSNFFALKGLLNADNESITLSEYTNNDNSKYEVEDLNNIKSKLKIKELSYVSKLNLISACIGTINGPTISSEEDFTPHFSPIWMKDKVKYETYAYPYQTEGMLVEFDKEEIIKWMENELDVKFKGKAEDVLLSFEKGTEQYELLHSLLHTISHHLIKKSSIFTGIDSDSCSEMIFPTTGSILIYSTSTINIGGFGSLFENNLVDFFLEDDEDVSKCIYDPLCLSEQGACFSCLHLPEFVCAHFNTNLDRSLVFGGSKRNKKPFW